MASSDEKLLSKTCFSVKIPYQKRTTHCSSMFPFFIEVKMFHHKGHIMPKWLLSRHDVSCEESITLQSLFIVPQCESDLTMINTPKFSGKLFFLFTILHFFMFLLNSFTSSFSSYLLIKLNQNHLKIIKNKYKCL